MNQPTTVFFFQSGNTAATDESGEQIPELQVPRLTLYIEFLVSKGVDPTTVEFRTSDGPIRVFKNDDGGWTWRYS